MLIGTPFPCRSAFGNAVEETLREQRASHGMSARQRTWVALCVRAVLVTHASCWGRFERARLGTDALAAFSWLLRHSKMPGHALLVARVRVILRHSGIPSGSLVVDETAHPRSQSAQPLAPLDKLRAKERGGALWGHSLVLLVLVTPQSSLPVGLPCYRPAPELRAWDRQETSRNKPGVLKAPRVPTPPPQTIRIRGGDERGALVRRARVYVCSHQTQRVSVASKDAEAATYR